MKRKGFPCLCAAGLGERNTESVPCELRDGYKGRTALRAMYDAEGRWLIQWRNPDGTEFVGTYRLLPV